jgi:hypothetical protein
VICSAESGRVGEVPLDLHEKNGEFMIRVNGLELMKAFGSLRASPGPGGFRGDADPRPRILLGGLGIGYTLAALLRNVAVDLRCLSQKTRTM